jgi:hypothetical protein
VFFIMHVRSVSRRLRAAALAALLGLALAACASTTTTPAASTSSGKNGMVGAPGMSPTGTSGTASSAMTGMAMSTADPMPTGNGLAQTQDGYTLKLLSGSLNTTAFRFEILDSTGMAVTAFQPDQTKLMHFYLVRSDLTGYQHVHPTMAADGTWTAQLVTPAPGSYRVYSSFEVKDSGGALKAYVLSAPVSMPGSAATTALPATATSTTVDGYTLTVDGMMMAGMTHSFTVSVSKNGQPVHDLQPYLATYAHLTAIHQGDLAFAHLHPEGAAATTDTGGPTLTFQTAMSETGNWRLFIQFQTGGVLHTAAITLSVS